VKSKKMHAMTIRLEDDLKRSLERIAEQTGLAETDIIRLCIRAQIKEVEKNGSLLFTINSELPKNK
jgi:predicted transcriptional regulator